MKQAAAEQQQFVQNEPHQHEGSGRGKLSNGGPSEPIANGRRNGIGAEAGKYRVCELRKNTPTQAI